MPYKNRTSYVKIYSIFKIPYRRLHVLSETYQKALVLPREIDVQIDKIQVSSLPAGMYLCTIFVLSFG